MAYGLQVYNTAGSKVILDVSYLPGNLITCKIGASESFSSTIAAGVTITVTALGVTAANTAAVFVLVFGPAQLGTTPPFTVTRLTNSFTIKNNTTGNITVKYLAGRYT